MIMNAWEQREGLQASNIAKCSELFAFAADFYLLAHSYIEAVANQHKANEHFTLGIAILARGTNNLQGAVVLTEVGLTSEANSLSRAALECCFALGAMRSGYPLLEKLQRAHDRARKGWGEYQLRNRGASALTQEQLERIEQQIEDVQSGARLNYEELARNAGLTEYYETMYRPLSNFGTHLSEGSLSQLLEPNENDAEHIFMSMHTVLSGFGLLLREIERLFPVSALAQQVEQNIHSYADFLASQPTSE
jgi:hypothetical protein